VPYAVVLKGRDDPEAVLMVLDETAEAEAIAIELRGAGHAVQVRVFSERTRSGLAPLSAPN
jgi:hypothetical protein